MMTEINIASATMIIEFALVGYIEDCVGREGNEAQEVEEAWALILKKLKDND